MEQISLPAVAVAQLSFADLIVRRIPLTAAEAASLTLAAAEQGRVPDATQIFLNSTGAVSFGCRESVSPADESDRLASLLHQLLRLDETDGGERRGRVPGGLLVVLARTMRQIDLPALTPTAFCEALVRFGARTEPGVLAAIFWRAARLRAPNRFRHAGAGSTLAASPRRVERRLQGPAPAELRRWLRQTEREVFRLRQSRVAAASAAIIATFVVLVSFVIGLDLSHSSAAESARTVALDSRPVPTPEGSVTVVPSVPPRPVLEREPVERRARASLRPDPSPRVRRTVEMVNLPRASWAVVRTP